MAQPAIRIPRSRRGPISEPAMVPAPDVSDEALGWLREMDPARRREARERVKALIRSQLMSGDPNDAERVCAAFERKGYALVRRRVDAADKAALLGRFAVEVRQADEQGRPQTLRYEIPWAVVKAIRKAAIEAANLIDGPA